MAVGTIRVGLASETLAGSNVRDVPAVRFGANRMSWEGNANRDRFLGVDVRSRQRVLIP
jgi:hypothetical protein